MCQLGLVLNYEIQMKIRPSPTPSSAAKVSLDTEYEDLPNNARALTVTLGLLCGAVRVGQVMSLCSAPTRSPEVRASPAPILLWAPDSGGHCYLCWDIDVATAIKESC